MNNMKKKLGLLLGGVLLSLSVLVGCDQMGAKNFGGNYTIELPKGEKLVNVTWKDSDLWYLTEPMTDEDEPKTYKLNEDSTFGVWEGTVTIVESK